MAERTERGSIGLIQRNREIAEVREEILQADQQLDATQTRNHSLLEETSVLDSSIYEQAGRAANAEMQLAVLMGQTREREEELASQQDAQAAQATALQAEIAERAARLQTAETEAASRKESLTSLDGEVMRLQALLEAENMTIANVRRVRQEPSLGLTVHTDTTDAARRAIEDELQAVLRRQDKQQEEAAVAKQGIGRLEAELAEEKERREEVSATLRKAVVEQADGTRRVRTAESEIAARGGDARGALARLKAAVAAGEDLSSVGGGAGGPEAGRRALLRSELQTAQEQCNTVQGSLDAQRGQDSHAAERLSSQLDEARSELQRSIREANDAHSSEVARFEAEVQSERQRHAEEEVSQRVCLDQLSQLRTMRDRAHDERGCAIVRTQAEAGRCAALVEELQRVQSEVRSVEGRLAAIQDRIAEAENRARTSQDAGAHKVAMLRSKIEMIWQALRTSRASAMPGTAGLR